MFTIFTIPKAFTDPHISLIQRNAIKSWKQLTGAKIILIGNDPGVAETAQEFQVKHLPDVACNEFGTPLLDSAFALAKKNSDSDILIYANADIIFLENLASSLEKLPLENFLTVGRRIDLDVEKEINFKNADWGEKIKTAGHLHSVAGIDYFIFKKNSFANIPPFAIGRVGWDNWMIYEAHCQKMAIIDATEDITAIHQNHSYPTHNDRDRKTNPEAKNNAALVEDRARYFTIEDANWKLTKGKLIKKRFTWWPSWKRYSKLKFK